MSGKISTHSFTDISSLQDSTMNFQHYSTTLCTTYW